MFFTCITELICTSPKKSLITCCFVNPIRTVNMYVKREVVNGSSKDARVVDLRSDTLTKPSPQMRKAMFDAEVGDDVYGEDPTVNALEVKAASMLGKANGLYVSSGTMGNLIAILAHCGQRGSEMITGDLSHMFLFEQGGAAQLAGVHMHIIPNNPDGTFDIELMEKKIRTNDLHYPITSLICVENTHNMCGGKVLPLAWMDKLGSCAKRHGIPLHMDGARLFNAAVHLKVPASRIVRDCASVSICLSKGLGAPVGSVLVGDSEFIHRARRMRKALGGAMRQAGIIAATGLYSLTNMVDRLADDHSRTAIIAKAIHDMKSPVMSVDIDNIHTNILMIQLDPIIVKSTEFVDRMATVTADEATKLGENAVVVKIGPRTEDIVRLVVHCDILDNDVGDVVTKLRFMNEEYISKK